LKFNEFNHSVIIKILITFWSLVEGSHEDQIYLHIGNVNLEKGIFDLAG
jgi:hypothetical protein